jgi:hypothetical protein
MPRAGAACNEPAAPVDNCQALLLAASFGFATLFVVLVCPLLHNS